MKLRKIFLRALLMSAASPVFAADGTWNTAVTGGLWGTSGNWTGGVIADGSGATAHFETLDITADTTVNLDASRTLGNLVFGDTATATAAGWVLDNNGNAANILTLAGTTPTVTVNALGTGKTAAINAVIAGTAGLTKAGVGTLTLSGTSANTYTGTTTLSAGYIVLSKTAGVTAIAGDITMNNGGNTTLWFTADNQLGGNGLLTFAGGGGNARFDLVATKQSLAGIADATGRGVVQNSEANYPSGAPTNTGAGTLTLTGTGTYSFNGYLRDSTGTLALAKTSSGTQTLSGGNISYTGATTLSGGRLVLQNTTAFNSAVAINGGTLELASTGAWTDSKALSGAGAIEKTGAGTVTLSGANTNTGTISVLAGTLDFLNANSFYNSTSGGVTSGNAANLTVASGATAGFGYGGAGQFTATDIATLLAASNGTVGFKAGSSLGLDTTSAGSAVWASAITDTGAGALGFAKLGTGMLTLTGNHTYTGNTVIAGGTLTLGAGATLGGGNYAGTIANTGTFIHNSELDQTLTGGVSGTGALLKSGTGTLTLTNTSNYSGTTTVTGGRLVLRDTSNFVSAITNNGVVEFNATGPTTSQIKNVIAGSGDYYKTGSGITQFNNNQAIIASGNFYIQQGTLQNNNNAINWSGSTVNMDIGGGAILDLFADAIYVNKLTGTGFVQNNYGNSSGQSGSSAYYEKFVVGTAGGSSTFNGTIRDNSNGTAPANATAGGGIQLEKTGTGTLTLAGTNSYSGTTTVNGGVLALDYTTNNTNKLATGAALVFGGGNLSVLGNGSANTAQSVSTTTLNNGGATVTVTENSGANTATLNLNAITRNLGGTLNVVYAGSNAAGAKVTTDNLNTAGILGAWVTMNGTDWATNATNGADGLIAAYTGYVADTWAAGNNTDVSLAGADPAPGSTTNTLRFNAAGAKTLTLTGVNTLAAGGLLVSSNVGANDTLVTGGTLAGSAGGELIVQQHNPAGKLTVASVIADNTSATALTKAGAGTLILSNTANTYTGKTYLNGGVTEIAADTSLGAVPGAVVADRLSFNGGTLRFGTAGIVMAANRGITVNAAGATFDTNGFTATLAQVIAGSGSLAKTGSGTLTLNGINTFTGIVNANNGLITSAAADSAAGGFLGGVGAASARRTVNIASGAQISYTSATANGFLNMGANVATGGFGSFYDFNISGTLAINDGGTVSQILQSTYNLNNGGVITNTGVAHTGGYGLLFGWNGAGGGNINVTGTGNRITADRIGFFNGAAINTNAGADLTISSIIKDATGGPASTLTKNGAGTLILTGANTYTGATTVNAGRLILQDTSNFLSGIANNAVVEFNSSGANSSWVRGVITGSGDYYKTGGGITKINNGQSITASGRFYIQAGTLQNDNNAVNWSGSTASMDISTGAILDLFADAIVVDRLTGTGFVQNNYGNSSGQSGGAANYEKLVVGVANGSSTFDGVIRNNFAGTAPAGSTAGGGVELQKTGTGTFTLTGVNTYTGVTAVTAGTLLINGNNIAATGAITVASGATLGGVGTTGATLVTVNGNITGGDVTTTGTLTANAVTLTATGAYVAQISSATATADLLAVNGALALGGSQLTLTDINAGAFTLGNKLTLASYANITGTFANYTEGEIFTLSGNQWRFSYNDGNAITITAVPEPATYGLLGAGALAGFAFVRRRRRCRVA